MDGTIRRSHGVIPDLMIGHRRVTCGDVRRPRRMMVHRRPPADRNDVARQSLLRGQPAGGKPDRLRHLSRWIHPADRPSPVLRPLPLAGFHPAVRPVPHGDRSRESIRHHPARLHCCPVAHFPRKHDRQVPEHRVFRWQTLRFPTVRRQIPRPSPPMVPDGPSCPSQTAGPIPTCVSRRRPTVRRPSADRFRWRPPLLPRPHFQWRRPPPHLRPQIRMTPIDRGGRMRPVRRLPYHCPR